MNEAATDSIILNSSKIIILGFMMSGHHRRHFIAVYVLQRELDYPDSFHRGLFLGGICPILAHSGVFLPRLNAALSWMNIRKTIPFTIT